MDDTTILGGVLNQLGQTAKQTVKQIVKLPEEMAADVAGQVGNVKKDEDKTQKQWQSDEERMKFLKDLYGKSDMPRDGSLKTDKQTAAPDEKPTDKSAEEQKELLSLRDQLHKENYYDPTFNPVKKQEERPAEKVEMEKKQEMQELEQKDAKKPSPLAVQREQNKAEQFRGAAG